MTTHNESCSTHESTCCGKSSTFVKGAVIGGLIGAAAALLLAPKSGRELRSDISNKAQEVGSKTKEVATDLSVKATTAAKIVSEKAEDVVDKLRDTSTQFASQVKDAAQLKKEQLKQTTADVVNSVADELESGASSLHDAVEDKTSN